MKRIAISVRDLVLGGVPLGDFWDSLNLVERTWQDASRRLWSMVVSCFLALDGMRVPQIVKYCTITLQNHFRYSEYYIPCRKWVCLIHASKRMASKLALPYVDTCFSDLWLK